MRHVRMPGHGSSPLPWSPCLTALPLAASPCLAGIVKLVIVEITRRHYTHFDHARPATQNMLRYRNISISIASPLEMQDLSILCRSLKFVRFRRLDKIHV